MDYKYSCLRDNWSTPDYLFENLNMLYNFTLDPCSDDRNYKVKKHYTLKDDGLKQSWKNEVVFMNPPYGRCIYNWIKKADYEVKHNNCIVVALLPARTDTKWFHEFLYNKDYVLIEFLKGRLSFDNIGRAPFPSMIVYWDPKKIKRFGV